MSFRVLSDGRFFSIYEHMAPNILKVSRKMVNVKFFSGVGEDCGRRDLFNRTRADGANIHAIVFQSCKFDI